MSTELVWLLIGWVTSVPLVWVGFVAYQWLHEQRSYWRPVEVDDYTARLRALDRPRQVAGRDDPLLIPRRIR